MTGVAVMTESDIFPCVMELLHSDREPDSFSQRSTPVAAAAASPPPVSDAGLPNGAPPPKTLSQALNQKIRELLVVQRWSQREFARRLGVTQGAVSYMLNDKRRAQALDFYQELATNIFSISLSVLIADLVQRVAPTYAAPAAEGAMHGSSAQQISFAKTDLASFALKSLVHAIVDERLTQAFNLGDVLNWHSKAAPPAVAPAAPPGQTERQPDTEQRDAEQPGAGTTAPAKARRRPRAKGADHADDRTALRLPVPSSLPPRSALSPRSGAPDGAARTGDRADGKAPGASR